MALEIKVPEKKFTSFVIGDYDPITTQDVEAIDKALELGNTFIFVRSDAEVKRRKGNLNYKAGSRLYLICKLFSQSIQGAGIYENLETLPKFINQDPSIYVSRIVDPDEHEFVIKLRKLLPNVMVAGYNDEKKIPREQVHHIELIQKNNVIGEFTHKLKSFRVELSSGVSSYLKNTEVTVDELRHTFMLIEAMHSNRDINFNLEQTLVALSLNKNYFRLRSGAEEKLIIDLNPQYTNNLEDIN